MPKICVAVAISSEAEPAKPFSVWKTSATVNDDRPLIGCAALPVRKLVVSPLNASASCPLTAPRARVGGAVPSVLGMLVAWANVHALPASRAAASGQAATGAPSSTPPQASPVQTAVSKRSPTARRPSTTSVRPV